MNTHKIFNLMLVFAFAFSFLGIPVPVFAQGYYPKVAVSYSNDSVAMWGWTTGTEVTLTIDNPTNGPGIDYSTSTIMGTPDDVFRLRNLFDIQPGDIVAVSDIITTRQVIVTNVRVTGVDLETDKAYGTADPFHSLIISVYGNFAPQAQPATADEFGNWQADFGGISNIDGSTTIYAFEGDNNAGTRFGFVVPTISVELQNNRVDGITWQPGNEVTMTIDDPSNGLGVDFSDTRTAPQGIWRPTTSFNLGAFIIHPDQLVTMTDGITTRRYTIDNITIMNVDPVLEIVSGTTDPGAQVTVGPITCNEQGCYGTRHISTDTNGNWLADFAHVGEDSDEQEVIDIQLGMRVSAHQCNDDGDCTQFNWGVPYIDASVDGDSIWANEWPLGRTVTLTIDQPGTPQFPDYTDTKAVEPDVGNSGVGEVNFNLYGIYQYQAGDLITLSDGTLTKTLMVANILVTGINFEAETISGTADPGAEIEVDIWTHNAPYRRAVVDGNGRWTADFSTPWNDQSTYDLVPGLDGGVLLYDNDRDSTSAKWTTIHTMNVHVDENFVATFGWLPGTPLRMTISGSVNYSDELFPSENRTQFDWPRSLAHLQVGDFITITDGFITINHAISPVQVTNIDVAADTVEGIATPLSNLEVHTDTTITGGGCCAGRWVTADASGHWVADFHDPLAAPPGSRYPTADLVPGSPGQAIEYDDEGNETWVNWGVPNPTIEANITGQWIHAREWPQGMELTLTIDDPANGIGVDYTGIGVMEHNPDNPGDPNDIRANFAWPAMGLQPGFIVKVTGNGTSKTLIVSSLQVQNIDVEADTIEGTASPGATIQICANIPNNCINRYVTADGSGTWLADYHNPGTQPDEQETMDIQRGTDGWASIRDEDGDETSANWQAPNPMIWANLTSYDHQDDSVWSMGWPLEAVVTLEIDDPETTQNPDYTASQPGELVWWAPTTTFVWFKLQGMFEIRPGYFVRMSDGTYVKTLTVKNISITRFDVSADIISGIAAPGIQVNSNVDDAYRHVMPDAAGNWTADFAHVGTQADEQTTSDIVPGIIIGSIQEDEDGDSTVFNWRVPVNQPPVANSGTDQIVFAGETITLDASASSDPEAGTLTYVWDLDDDGQYDDANGVTVTTSFYQPGEHVIALQVTDDGGLIDTDTVMVVVLAWTIKGFYQPVDMNGVYNIVKGGSTVPLKFEIFAGSTELTDVSKVKSLMYAQTSCDSTAITDEIETTATGGTSLRYADGQFVYNWKTPETAGRCYRVTLNTLDGSSLIAYFKFK